MEGPDEMSSSSPRRYDASRRQADARARRRRVIDAATELFAEHGFGDTSIQRIADEAGVSVQTVYAVFGSKPGILHAVVDVAVGGDDEEVLVRDRPELAWVSEERDPEKWLVAMAAFITGAHRRSARLLHLVESVAGSDPALAELAASLNAARRSDSLFAIANGPIVASAAGRTEAEAADLLSALGGVPVWIELVERGGWTPERYEAWLLDALRRDLLPS